MQHHSMDVQYLLKSQAKIAADQIEIAVEEEVEIAVEEVAETVAEEVEKAAQGEQESIQTDQLLQHLEEAAKNADTLLEEALKEVMILDHPEITTQVPMKKDGHVANPENKYFKAAL